MLKTAIYTRISKDAHGEGRGVDRQLTDCRELVARHDEWALTESMVFSDNDISATTGKRRPDYERLMTAVRGGEVQVIVVYMLSRLWRNRKERAGAMEALAAAKARVVSVKGPDLDLSSATGQMLLGLMGEFDTFETAVKSERQRRANLETAEQGHYHGSRRPFGYQIIWTTDAAGRRLRTLEPDPAEADLVREAARRIIGGDSLYGIAADWNARDIRTTSGGRWDFAPALRAILTAPRNIGVRLHEAGKGPGSRRTDATVEYPATWPAILDRETFEDVCTVLADPSRRTAATTARVHLLAGFVVCGTCGEPMRAAKTSTGADRYRCTAYLAAARGESADHQGRRGTSRAAAGVEREVTRRIFEWLSDNGLYDQARASVEDSGVREARQRRRTLEARRSSLADYLADGTFTKADYNRQVRRIAAEVADIDRILTRHVGGKVLDGVPRGDELRVKWREWEVAGAAGLEKRREIVAALVDRVIVHPTLVGRKRDDPSRIQVFPAAWAETLADPDAAAPAPVPDVASLPEQVCEFLAAHPGETFTRPEIAAAVDCDPDALLPHLHRLTGDGSIQRAASRRVAGPGRAPHQYTFSPGAVRAAA